MDTLDGVTRQKLEARSYHPPVHSGGYAYTGEDMEGEYAVCLCRNVVCVRAVDKISTFQLKTSNP